MLTAVVAILLLGVLTFAVVRPRDLPEALVAVPAALVAVLAGALSWTQVGHEIAGLASTVGFLAAILVLGYLCEREGVFAWAGERCAAASRGNPRRLLLLVFALASATTAVLSLDATVVLLTPVVYATATRQQVPARPHVFACAHLANAGSLLLPVSNLTNLLALPASGLSAGRFALLMALPWAVVLAVEYLVFRRFFRADLAGHSTTKPVAALRAPVVALVVLAVTLPGFLVVEPVWAATPGAAVLTVRALVTHRVHPVAILAAANLPFLAFVLALGVLVTAVQENGLRELVAALIPSGESLPALLLIAGLAMVLANLVNNIPATLVLLPPVAAAAGPVGVLAVLIGVNLGPNLTYVGSLATLLWRRLLRERDAEPLIGDFLRLGALTTPVGIVAAVGSLWLSWQWIGG